ncbi:MAG: ABC transporter ATP-binding protein [Dysgonamonadaceae bacterium]|jgi:putative ABC transport system ATP-binding protein|nr:ABC transporter ATP-binding protein [Dysgonamonadaceae bacterium]
MITLENISKTFQTKEIETLALDNINLSIEKGEFVSIMGPSGCGKSTMLHIMGLLDQPTGGRVFINGADVSGLTDKQTAQFRNRTLGFIFQSFHLIPALNVLDNVELPLLYRKGVSAKERRQRAQEVLEKVELSHRLKHFPAQLSGGQCQRVAIARALVGNPEVILADEPTGNLDSKMGDEIMSLLTSINQFGTTIVMVTHDEKLAERTHRIIRLLDGKIQ